MAPLIYVIDLDRDAERMASIRANLEALGLPFERLPAVMGKDVPEWEKLVDLPAYSLAQPAGHPAGRRGRVLPEPPQGDGDLPPDRGPVVRDPRG
jgi:GR25 family glycosyltransferase involved in LPS biosynthesis